MSTAVPDATLRKCMNISVLWAMILMSSVLIEIPDKIKDIDDNEKRLIKKGIEHFSYLIKNGGMLINAISEVLHV